MSTIVDSVVSSIASSFNQLSGKSQYSGYLSSDEYELINSYWEVSNYLSIGQVYLKDNPLLRDKLQASHIKPRLLGHWGTVPGLNLIYTHMNRCIKKYHLNALYMTGPGHGGPALVAQSYMEGVYTEIYPNITMDETGMKQLFCQFSTPGGIPSHVSPPTPGSIHEGGELGYVLSHAGGAVFDNPDLLCIAVVGDGEAETAPLEGAWKIISFLNPVHDGAVLPILHLNGYKIANPTVLGRETDENIRSLFHGHGYKVHFVEGNDPAKVHHEMGGTLDTVIEEIQSIQREARISGKTDTRPRWPMIVLRTPKGWTGPKQVDGKAIEGTFRSHQVPLSGVRENPAHLSILEQWMRSYQPEKHFDSQGRLVETLRSFAPSGTARMSANPHANGGKLMEPLKMSDMSKYAYRVSQPCTEYLQSTSQLGEMVRDIYASNPKNFRLFCPDETNSNRLGQVFEIENRCFMNAVYSYDDHVSHDGRVMEVLSENLCQGWLEAYNLTGRHGLFASYEAFTMIVSSMLVQHFKWIDACRELPWRAPIPSLNLLLTSTCWRNDHNGFSHQGPGLIDTVLSKKGEVIRVYLPCDANTLLSVSDHCFRSQNYINLIVIDKQPQLQYMTIKQAQQHCAKGAGQWEWASNTAGKSKPDIVLACAGDVVTMETVAAADILRRQVPDFSVRVVNVVDLMCLSISHPHGASNQLFDQWFTSDVDVCFQFHGYPMAIHSLIHGRNNAHRFHVAGFSEAGTTTTPFLMTSLNKISRYHIVMQAIKHTKLKPDNADTLVQWCQQQLKTAQEYAYMHYEDMEQIRNWTWQHDPHGTSDKTDLAESKRSA